ncbi:MAG: DedA family protein [Acidobacteriota bacterium]
MKSFETLGIFLFVFIENLGIPFPTEGGYVLATLMIKAGYPYWMMQVILLAGHMAGSILAYFLGLSSHDFVMRRFSQNQSFTRASEWLTGWYDKHGSVTVFVARFVGYIRPWSSLVAGFAEVNVNSFVFWTFSGSLIFNLAFIELNLRFLKLYQSHGIYFKILMIALIVLSFSAVFLAKYLLPRKSKL